MTPVLVSVLTQPGPDFLRLEEGCFQVQITGYQKIITQRLILLKSLRITIEMVSFY